MQVWRSIGAVDVGEPSTAVTVGNFDGMHRGHQHVLSRLRELAGERGGLPVVVVTFDPHPMRVLRPDKAPVALTTLEQRLELMAGIGVDGVLVLPFDKQMAAWTPQRFAETVLAGALRADVVVVGENFRFGHRASGDVTLLAQLGAQLGFGVEALSLVGEAQPWSSTLVRERLADGDVAAAAAALGRPHAVRGVVVEGEHRGRALGYPTANVPTTGVAAVPADGIYAGWLRRLDDDTEPLPAAVSVGSNPTFGGTERMVEAYVLDRDDLELYDVPVEVSFVARLRGMERFDDVPALVAQMARDVEQAHRVLSVPTPGAP